MNRITLGVGALMLSTSLASAGALDRSGQPVTALFAEGRVVELSFGFTQPDVQGTFPFNGARSGNLGVDFSQVALSFKTDLSERLSVALILDEPFGADVDYDETDPTYPISGSFATLDTTGITALARYRLSDAFSVHGGARSIRVEPDLTTRRLQPGVGPVAYDGEFESDSDIGFVLGAAYERPEIALRVALTYSSETSFAHDTSYRVTTPAGAVEGTSADTTYTLPQSVNLDVQTGIAEGTLLFGSIRWVDWSETSIAIAPPYPEDANPVVSYDEDIFTYALGIGRRFTDQLSASASVIYEPGSQSDFNPATGTGGVSNLGPTNGQTAIQLAATYSVTENIDLSGAIRYTRLGDATTRRLGARFEDNDALTLGLRAAYRF